MLCQLAYGQALHISSGTKREDAMVKTIKGIHGDLWMGDGVGIDDFVGVWGNLVHCNLPRAHTGR